jgi:hypothetical protein
MKSRFALWIIALSGMLVSVGCAPAGWDRSYYGSPAYYGGSTPYYGGRYDSVIPYRVYDESYYGPSRSYGRSHAREHEALEHKYDKAMNRLDRQEREAEQKIIRRYDGNTADPRFQEQARRIDEKYDHKRGKVERNIAKEHREYHQDRW